MSHAVQVALGVASVAMFAGSLLAVPLFLVRIPDDYFVRERPRGSVPAKILRTALGVALIVVGLAMLVLPGQGLLTILVGAGILELPQRDRLIRWLLSLPRVHGAIDALRRRRGKGSLAV